LGHPPGRNTGVWAAGGTHPLPDSLLVSRPILPDHLSRPPKEFSMHLTAAHFGPLVALIAGILILIVPRLLNYIVAVYLILVGLIGLNGIYHFVH
jgi:hypothetical protein